MSTSSNFMIDWTEKEAKFIDRTMRSVSISNLDVYLDMLLKIVDNLLTEKEKTLITNDAIEVLESIRYKLCDRRANIEIENMLIDPNYGKDYHTPTKLLSYSASQNTSSANHLKIIQLLQKQDMSRNELADASGLRLSTVCGRVKELLDAGFVAVVDKKLDPATNRMVEVLCSLS